jgi:hypothetical protein
MPLKLPLPLLILPSLSALSALLFQTNSKPSIIAHLLQVLQLTALAVDQRLESGSLCDVNGPVVVVIHRPDQLNSMKFPPFSFL